MRLHGKHAIVTGGGSVVRVGPARKFMTGGAHVIAGPATEADDDRRT